MEINLNIYLQQKHKKNSFSNNFFCLEIKISNRIFCEEQKLDISVRIDKLRNNLMLTLSSVSILQEQDITESIGILYNEIFSLYKLYIEIYSLYKFSSLEKLEYKNMQKFKELFISLSLDFLKLTNRIGTDNFLDKNKKIFETLRNNVALYYDNLTSPSSRKQ